jgi:hypothetical protein
MQLGSMTKAILWVDDVAVASICSRPNRIIFALRDNDGSHLTIWKKDDGCWVEYSSNKPLGSVWDEARRGIARGCGYPKWRKHANYILNCPLSVVANSTVNLITFSMPRSLKPSRPSLNSMPAIHMKSPGEPYDLSLEFVLSGTYIASNSEAFEADIGNLIITLIRHSQPKGPWVIQYR